MINYVTLLELEKSVGVKIDLFIYWIKVQKRIQWYSRWKNVDFDLEKKVQKTKSNKCNNRLYLKFLVTIVIITKCIVTVSKVPNYASSMR